MVLRMIEEANAPISTTTLIARLAETRCEDGPDSKSRYNGSTPVWRHRCIGVRKSLREAAKKGKIQHLGVGPDGSYLWASNDLSPAQCAAGFANAFFQIREVPVQVDPSEFEKWASEHAQEEE